MDVLAKVIIVTVSAIVFVAVFRDEWRKLRAQEREYDAFQRSREERQAEFDRHAKALARAMLMEQAAKIHFVGEVWHD